ncbi:hypothetical protein ACHAP4_000899 [Fusarium culmorum]
MDTTQSNDTPLVENVQYFDEVSAYNEDHPEDPARSVGSGKMNLPLLVEEVPDGQLRAKSESDSNVRRVLSKNESDYCLTVDRLVWIDGWHSTFGSGDNKKRKQEMTLLVLNLKFENKRRENKIGSAIAELTFLSDTPEGQNPEVTAWGPFRRVTCWNPSTVQSTISVKGSLEASAGFTGQQVSALVVRLEAGDVKMSYGGGIHIAKLVDCENLGTLIKDPGDGENLDQPWLQLWRCGDLSQLAQASRTGVESTYEAESMMHVVEEAAGAVTFGEAEVDVHIEQHSAHVVEDESDKPKKKPGPMPSVGVSGEPEAAAAAVTEGKRKGASTDGTHPPSLVFGKAPLVTASWVAEDTASLTGFVVGNSNCAGRSSACFSGPGHIRLTESSNCTAAGRFWWRLPNLIIVKTCNTEQQKRGTNGEIRKEAH